MKARDKKQKPTDKEALLKARKYCAYQERCHQEVRDKLYEWGLARSKVENIIAELINTGFINEERFARVYAGGKFRQKKWGRNRIVMELKKRKITEYCIRKGMEEIEEDRYLKVLTGIIREKATSLREKNDFIKKDKISKYCINKGYEPELVWNILKQANPG